MTLVAPSETTFYDCYRGSPLRVIDSLPVANATPVAGGDVGCVFFIFALVTTPCVCSGWTAYSGLDCSQDHGAYELGTSTDDLALQECQALCDDNYLCEGVVFVPSAHGRTGWWLSCCH